MFSQVAFQPVPSLAPNPPQMMSTTMPLLKGVVGGLSKLGQGATPGNLFSNDGDDFDLPFNDIQFDIGNA